MEEYTIEDDVMLVKAFIPVYHERPNERYSMFWKRVKEIHFRIDGNPKRRKWYDLCDRFDIIRVMMVDYIRILRNVLQTHGGATRQEKVSIYTHQLELSYEK